MIWRRLGFEEEEKEKMVVWYDEGKSGVRGEINKVFGAETEKE